MGKQILLKTNRLTKAYNGEVLALYKVNLTIKEGEFIAVMGPSGSGKSTLLYMLGALDRPTSGEIMLRGEDITQKRNLDSIRSRMIGFVFQLHNLMPTLNAMENILVPMRNSPLPRGERRKRAESLLAMLDLTERSGHLPSQLSGGQRQKVAIARALANDPALILADEPTGNLDSTSGNEIMRILKRLNEEQGRTILVVTHDPGVAKHARRLILLRDGKVISDQANPRLTI